MGEIQNNQQLTLNLQDLLLDEQTDVLTEYLSLSVENIGLDTKVSLTTVEEMPITYSAMLSEVSVTGLNCLLAGHEPLQNE